MSDKLSDQAFLDEIAKEIYIRRVFNIKDVKDYELEQSANDCYKKAQILVKVRQYHLPIPGK